jgi:SAM-dependent methyltransferase
VPDREEIAFEEIYAGAGEDLASIPWADLTANPAMTAWLDGRPVPDGASGLVVACGLGDDAEELARRGYRVTAFDVSPTAIELCHQRFPASRVDYIVADVFDLPSAWAGAFALVVEIRTLQSLPLDRRQTAARAIAATVAPGGVVFVRAAARDPDEPLGSRPWPLTRAELEAFTRAGLVELSFRDEAPPPGRRFRMFTAVYERPR